MKSLWTRGNTHACTPAHTQTHMLNAYTHTETFQPSQAEAGAAPQRRKEANASTVQLKEKKKKGVRVFFSWIYLDARSHLAFSLLSLSLFAFCLSRLVSDPPRRIAAVKLLTSSSCSVVTLCSARSSACVCRACVWLSVTFFDVFIRLSRDLGRNRGLRKEWEFPLSCPLLRGRGRAALMPSAGGGPPFNGLISAPFNT